MHAALQPASCRAHLLVLPACIFLYLLHCTPTPSSSIRAPPCPVCPPCPGSCPAPALRGAGRSPLTRPEQGLHKHTLSEDIPCWLRVVFSSLFIMNERHRISARFPLNLLRWSCHSVRMSGIHPRRTEKWTLSSFIIFLKSAERETFHFYF